MRILFPDDLLERRIVVELRGRDIIQA